MVATPGPRPIPIPGPTSPQSSLIASGQRYLLFPSFTLESGTTITNVPVAYKTWGTLNPTTKNNALVVCHALTGSADVEDWWGPLLGPSRLFDPTRFFIVCANVLGSPYGSAGPCTRRNGENKDADAKGEDGWDGKGWWGPEFPATSVRDDVRIHKLVLDYLGVEQIAAVVGGSMGGMAVLEWAFCFPIRFPPAGEEAGSSSSAGDAQTSQKPYIRAIVPIATSARNSAWCISWGEAQRQSIYSDPAFEHGYYSPDEPPRNGLAAARMAALLTYRSRDSFESRFGRRIGQSLKGGGKSAPAQKAAQAAVNQTQNGARRASVAEEAALAHNEGNQSPRSRPTPGSEQTSRRPNGSYFEGQANTNTRGEGEPTAGADAGINGEMEGLSLTPTATTPPVPATPHSAPEASDHPASEAVGVPPAYSPSTLVPKVFSAQSYLRYQGDKFVKRFDANCYIHLTRKMDSHDVVRGRAHWGSTDSSISDADAAPTNEEEEDAALMNVLGLLGSGSERFGAQAPRVLVVSIESDGLFAPPEQRLMHALIPGSKLVNIVSPDGHDGFLLEFEQINTHVDAFLRETLGRDTDIYEGLGVGHHDWKEWKAGDAPGVGTGGERADGQAAVKESVFGEVEDVTRW